jgi:glutamine amidotransferase
MTKVCILDYGSGNVSSVKNLIDHLKFKCVISNKLEVLKKSTHIILPGVGAFGAAMKKIKQKIPFKTLENEVLNKNKPFLGICVGMQLLADKSQEFGNHKGFGWIKGDVKKIKTKKLPHIGWNDIVIKKNSSITNNLEIYKDFYFVNSFYFDPKENDYVVAITKYGHNFCSIVQKKNIIGVQFHPEKSQQAGQVIIKNFLKMK